MRAPTSLVSRGSLSEPPLLHAASLPAPPPALPTIACHRPCVHHRDLLQLCLVARGVVGFIALYCYFEGTRVLPLGNLTVISRLHPALSSVLCAVLLDEPLRRSQLWVLGSAMLGVAIVAQPR